MCKGSIFYQAQRHSQVIPDVDVAPLSHLVVVEVGVAEGKLSLRVEFGDQPVEAERCQPVLSMDYLLLGGDFLGFVGGPESSHSRDHIHKESEAQSRCLLRACGSVGSIQNAVVCLISSSSLASKNLSSFRFTFSSEDCFRKSK